LSPRGLEKKGKVTDIIFQVVQPEKKKSIGNRKAESSVFESAEDEWQEIGGGGKRQPGQISRGHAETLEKDRKGRTEIGLGTKEKEVG